MSMLKLENVKYRNILKGISFDIEEKSFNILVGPNGSGKTTLVKILAELIEFEGKITFDGQREDVGFFTENNLFSYKKVIDNLTFILINLGFNKKKSEEKAIKLLKYFDLEYLINREIIELSYEEKRLVEFLSSIIHNPKLIIIDDSFEYLRDIERNKIITKLKKLDVSILFITNNIKDIFYADQIIIIKDGKTTFNGNLENLIKKEKNFIDNGLYPPFMLDLSYKLLDYKLLDKVILNEKEMVNAIWK